ncbi:Lsr2 family DNA-binding protein [Pseudonocardia spinosispora]|uniref:Lsr2 family DNA-binding protein n=1 Tax=Pseudonocardia spinosispora TaxID=103441 RepID=UPI00041CF57D|nr:histone-like nucleoid-structuring protein Lsr2 [Pseudonocardia spinosispora]
MDSIRERGLCLFGAAVGRLRIVWSMAMTTQEHARPVGQGKQRNRDIRDWAQLNGVYVGAQGRIPDQIKRAYADSRRRSGRLPTDVYGATMRLTDVSPVRVCARCTPVEEQGEEWT